MAVFSFIFGCMIGLFAALTGWLFHDISVFAAFGLYLSVSMTVGLALAVTAPAGSREPGHQMGA